MKITIYRKKVTPNALSFYGIEIECIGTGTMEDPVVIEPAETIPESIYLRDYSLFIQIRNLDKRYISLNRCQNITLKDCRLKYFDVFNSSNIKVENLSVTKLFRLFYSRDMLIEDSRIGKIKLKQSSSNTFKNCSFNKIKKILSNDNDFELITILGKQVSKDEERRFKDFAYKWNLTSLIYAIVLYVILFFFVPYILDFDVPIPFLIGSGVIFIFWYILAIIMRRRKLVK
jgi:hypothetical protein